jgi:hypothetical protein
MAATATNHMHERQAARTQALDFWQWSQKGIGIGTTRGTAHVHGKQAMLWVPFRATYQQQQQDTLSGSFFP